MLNISKNTFAMDDLKTIQNHFHELIIERAKHGWDCTAFLADENHLRNRLHHNSPFLVAGKINWI